MVRIVELSAMRTLLQTEGVQATLRGVSQYVREDFARWHEFHKEPRSAIHYPFGVMELMPIADDRYYSFKFVNGHPGNTRQGKLTVVAFGMLADVKTGYPLLISEMTVLTSLRTAATSALVARYCADPDTELMALIGCGSQAEFQILAMANQLPLREVRVYDRRPEAMQRLLQNLSGYSLRVVPCRTIIDAVTGVSLITTATAARCHQRILTAHDVTAGTHINAIGGDSPGKTELDVDLVRKARVIVEFEAQTRREGEIQLLPVDSPVIELADIVSGKAAARTSDDQITLFDSVGFALEDFSVLRYVYQRVRSQHLGYESGLVPEQIPGNDLFAWLVKQPPRKVSLA